MLALPLESVINQANERVESIYINNINPQFVVVTDQKVMGDTTEDSR
jgi:hypothetical protein